MTLSCKNVGAGHQQKSLEVVTQPFDSIVGFKGQQRAKNEDEARYGTVHIIYIVFIG